MQKSLGRVRWKTLIQPWHDVDGWLLVLPVLLTVLGGFMIQSTELSQGRTDWWQHWIVGAVGLGLALAIARCHYISLLRWRWFIYGIINVSLLAVMLVGTSALGAQRWISVGGFAFQPSEFAKLGVVIAVAGFLHERTAAKISMVLATFGVMSVPLVLVFLQPDLGTSLVICASILGILYWSNASPIGLLLLASPIISAILFNAFQFPPIWFTWVVAIAIMAWRTLPWRRVGAGSLVTINLLAGGLGHLLWGLLKTYQKDRLILFLDPDKDPLGGGYHLIQSRIAIGAGELWGQGFHHGTQTQLSFIPEQHTDFIFSAVGEEFGFMGSLCVLCIFWLISLRLVIIAQNAKDNFGSLLAIGVLSMIIFQVVINIGMTIGIAPVTGIPLPWVSYGSNALLTDFMAIGIAESVANFRKRLKFTN